MISQVKQYICGFRDQTVAATSLDFVIQCIFFIAPSLFLHYDCNAHEHTEVDKTPPHRAASTAVDLMLLSLEFSH